MRGTKLAALALACVAFGATAGTAEASHQWYKDGLALHWTKPLGGERKITLTRSVVDPWRNKVDDRAPL